MDRNQLIGWVLLSIMFSAYVQLSASRSSHPEHAVANQEQVAGRLTSSLQEEEARLVAPLPEDPAEYGLLAHALQGTEKEVVLENEVIKVTLTSRGARVKEVVLKNYQDHQRHPLTLLDAQSSMMSMRFTLDGKPIETYPLFFDVDAQGESTVETDGVAATFTLPIGPGQYLRHVFTLSKQGYTLTQHWEMVGVDALLGQEPMQFVWQHLIKRAEKDGEACRNRTTIHYCLAGNQLGHLKERSSQEQEQALRRPIQWIGIKQRFFTAGIVAHEAFSEGDITLLPTPHRTEVMKAAKVRLTLPRATLDQNKKGQLTFYFGPNDPSVLRKVATSFDRNIVSGLSVVRWTNQFLILPIFSLLEQYIGSYGVIIILLVLLIKLLLLPLSYRAHISMTKMRLLKPTMDALKARYGADVQKLQMAQMSLYRDMGVNPLGGCLPLLLQMPILLAMFNFFPNTIALRQKAFLWAGDLSTYDTVDHLPFHLPVYGSDVSLFALLMTVSTLLYTWSNNQLTPPEGPMKLLTYTMPFTLLLVLNRFPAGLTLCYFVSNVASFVQQSLIKRFVDEEALKKRLDHFNARHRDHKPSRLKSRLGKAKKTSNKLK